MSTTPTNDTPQPASATRPEIPAGFRELRPGEVSRATDKVWVGGTGPFSSLRTERITPGYAYRPAPAPGAVGYFVHIRRVVNNQASDAKRSDR
jgi:hypothetical protein